MVNMQNLESEGVAWTQSVLAQWFRQRQKGSPTKLSFPEGDSVVLFRGSLRMNLAGRVL